MTDPLRAISERRFSVLDNPLAVVPQVADLNVVIRDRSQWTEKHPRRDVRDHEVIGYLWRSGVESHMVVRAEAEAENVLGDIRSIVGTPQWSHVSTF